MVCFTLLGIFLAYLSSCIQTKFINFVLGIFRHNFLLLLLFKMLFFALYIISMIFAEILQGGKFKT